MSERAKKSFIWIALLSILLLGTGLRFINLSTPSIWIDELNHLYAAKSMLDGGEPRLPSGERYDRALLYTKLVEYSFGLFGINEFGLRFPSAFFGVICILVAFFVAQRFFGNITALLTALFVAVSPFAIGWSRLSRMYTLFQILFMVGLYAFYLGFESKKEGLFENWQAKILSAIEDRRLGKLLDAWNLNVFWLLFSLILFVICYTIQEITAIFFVGFLFYLGAMFCIQWARHGLLEAAKGKYCILLFSLTVVTALAFAVLPQLRSFFLYAINYAPKWSEGTRFQDRKLYLDFIFNHYNFPMGTLFVIGAYQIISRVHRSGIYALSLFSSYFFMFTFVFSYRHFQYLYNVYALFIMVSAFAVSNIVGAELDIVKRNWFSKARLNNTLLKGLIVCCFLVWLPLTPSLRLARRIPLSEDGSFNGAMYMEEWREACSFVSERLQDGDIVISTDALGTLYYLGKVDFCLSFSELDVAMENNLTSIDGEYFDMYSGVPFIQSVQRLEELATLGKKIFLLAQHYKLYEAPVFVPVTIREHILANYEPVLTTRNGTVVVFSYHEVNQHE